MIRRGALRRRAAFGLVMRQVVPLLVGVACARTPATHTEPAVPAGVPPSAPAADPAVPIVRVLLGTIPEPTVSATSAWMLVDARGRVVLRGGAGERATLVSRGRQLYVREYASGTSVLGDTMHLRATGAPLVTIWNGRRYRGELTLVPSDSGVVAVNRVGIEDYLRGVVPREIGVRTGAERAAIEAQAVAARSYTVARLRAAPATTRSFDLRATVSDQVYGGVNDEYGAADEAVLATAGLVLMHQGRIANALYHAACGGSTADPSEIWRARSEPYLKAVSDRIPGSDRHYCDIAPRFRWEVSWSADTLASVLERYLRRYATGGTAPLGAVRTVSIDGRTPSGRVAVLVIETEGGGTHRVRANDVRYVLRSISGDLLRSTYFSHDVLAGPDGRLARLTVRGVGNGHGAGMCQWGAIGRARAGHDFRTILRTYYPGTTVDRAY